MHGAGEQETKKREHWLHVQTQRGRSIRTVILSILIGSLGLFLLNHVTGSIDCDSAKQEAQTCSAFSWKSHADLAGDGRTYDTEKGDDLASVALAHEISPSLIGAKNTAAVFIPDDQLLTALGAAGQTPAGAHALAYAGSGTYSYACAYSHTYSYAYSRGGKSTGP